MFIILGPDTSGKSTLAATLHAHTGFPVYHHTYDTDYPDYLELLMSGEFNESIMDRFIWCDYPYSKVLGREPKLTIKEWDNITLTALIHRPLILLCAHYPSKHIYDPVVLPYASWKSCLKIYELWLQQNHLDYALVNYELVRNRDIDDLISVEKRSRASVEWWQPMWASGYGAVGSPTPQTLLVAERLGPWNFHHIPFEAGPTGWMLSELLHMPYVRVPYGSIAVTNMVKTGDSSQDKDLLSEELVNLRPSRVILMGAVAKQAIPLLGNIPYVCIDHLGYINRMKHLWPKYQEHWRELWHPQERASQDLEPQKQIPSLCPLPIRTALFKNTRSDT